MGVSSFPAGPAASISPARPRAPTRGTLIARLLPSTWNPSLAAGAAAALALLAGASGLANGLCVDGKAQVEEHPAVRAAVADPASLPGLLTTPYWPESLEKQALWRPLTTFSIGVTALVAGERAWPYHAFVLATHAAVAAAVVFLAWRLFHLRAGAFVAGALFAVHPIHSEVLGDTVGRGETLAALAGLLGLLAYLRAPTVRDPRFALALLLFFVATLAKEVGFAFPPLAASCDLLRPREPGEAPGRRGRLVFRWGLLALPLALHLLLRQRVLGSLEPTFTAINRLDNPLLFEPAGWRALNALAGMGRGLKLLAWPHPLAADYSVDQIPVFHDLADAGRLTAILAPVLLAVLGLAAAVRRRPAGLALFFLFVPWLPSSNLLFGAGTIFGERLLYLPSAGACLLAGLLFDRASRSRARLAASIAAALVAVGGARLAIRLFDWRNDFRLWEVTATRDAPRSARAHGAYGVRLFETGRLREAVAHLERALVLFPEYYHCYGKLAEIRRSEGDPAGAGALVLRALREQVRQYGRAAPDLPAFAYSAFRDFEASPEGPRAAQRAFRELLAEGFESAYLRAYLGEALAARGEFAASDAEYARALAGNPPGPVRASRAESLLLAEKLDEADAQAATISPDAAALARERAALVRGDVALRKGRVEAAMTYFEGALRDEALDPAIQARARAGRGIAASRIAAALRRDRPDESRRAWEAAREDLDAALRSGAFPTAKSEPAIVALGSALTALGDAAAGRAWVERALADRPASAALRLFLVGLEASEGRLSHARTHLAVLRAASPRETRLALFEGELRLASGDHEGAARNAEEVLLVSPGSAGARALRGRATVAAGRVDEGLAELAALVEQRPRDRGAAAWYGIALTDAGRPREGYESLRSAVEGPEALDDAAAHDAFARILGGIASGSDEVARDATAAARHAEEALRLAPGDPRYLLTRARLAIDAADAGIAADCLRRAGASAGDYPAVLRDEVERLRRTVEPTPPR